MMRQKNHPESSGRKRCLDGGHPKVLMGGLPAIGWHESMGLAFTRKKANY